MAGKGTHWPFPCWCCPWQNVEVTAWALDSAARGMLGISGTSFLSAALLLRASEAAGCSAADDECSNKIYGLRPASLLFLLAAVVGVLSGALMPITGAIIDHTPHRWDIGAATGYFMVACNAVQILILIPSAWEFVFFIQLCYIVALFLHGTVLLAYLPETTRDPQELDVITFSCAAWQFGAMIALLVLTVIVSSKAEFGTIGTAVVGQVVCLLFTVPAMKVAWNDLFQRRPASHALPPGSSVWTMGFHKLWVTFQDCNNRFTQLPKWLIGYIFAEAAAESYTTIAVVYLIEEIELKGTAYGLFFIFVIVTAVPGAFVGKQLTKRYGKFNTEMGIFMFFSVITLLLPFVAYKPEHDKRTFIFGAFIGLSMGGIFAANRSVYSAMIPGGEEAEYMGMYLFAGQFLVWLPPVIFLALNESGQRLRWGVWAVGLQMLVGTLLMLRTDFNQAVLDVSSTLDRRFSTDGGRPVSPTSKLAADKGAESNDSNTKAVELRGPAAPQPAFA